jgi:ATP-dependent Clp protease ATP-binding subunit ClpA
MHERFSDRARRALALANLEAVRLKHDHLGPEHIFLGILAKGGNVADAVLRNLAVNVDTLREEVARALPPGADAPHMAKLPQTPGTREVIDFAIQEARALGHRDVGTEHLLLGLIREGHALPARLLSARGVNVDTLRGEIIALLGAARGEELAPAAAHGGSEWLHQQELAKAFRSPGFWHLLVLAVEAANRLGDGEIRHEHLLLALLRDRGTAAEGLLSEKGVTLDWVQSQLHGGKA